MSVDASELRYAKTHEWLRLEKAADGGTLAVVGITDFAVQLLTDLIFIDLPQPGKTVTAGQPFGEVESVKAVSDLYAPVDGEVVEVNTAISEKLETINADPFGEGWLIKIRMRNPKQLDALLTLDAYRKQLESEAEA